MIHNNENKFLFMFHFSSYYVHENLKITSDFQHFSLTNKRNSTLIIIDIVLKFLIFLENFGIRVSLFPFYLFFSKKEKKKIVSLDVSKRATIHISSTNGKREIRTVSIGSNTITRQWLCFTTATFISRMRCFVSTLNSIELWLFRIHGIPSCPEEEYPWTKFPSPFAAESALSKFGLNKLEENEDRSGKKKKKNRKRCS